MSEELKPKNSGKARALFALSVSEVTREEMSDADVEDLRFLRNHLSQFKKDWSGVSKEDILDDFFWVNALSFIIRKSSEKLDTEDKRIAATGQLDLSPGDGIGVVEHIVAHPDMQGQGLGKMMMQKIIEEAQSRGMAKLRLTSNATREAAHGLYKSLGFKIVGEKQKHDEEGNPTRTTCIFELDLATKD